MSVTDENTLALNQYLNDLDETEKTHSKIAKRVNSLALELALEELSDVTSDYTVDAFVSVKREWANFVRAAKDSGSANVIAITACELLSAMEEDISKYFTDRAEEILTEEIKWGK